MPVRCSCGKTLGLLYAGVLVSKHHERESVGATFVKCERCHKPWQAESTSPLATLFAKLEKRLGVAGTVAALAQLVAAGAYAASSPPPSTPAVQPLGAAA